VRSQAELGTEHEGTEAGGRRGFTLLEMILALLIGLFLMGAVYTMFDRQFSHSKAGREATEEATLVRSIFARISTDIAGCLGPYDPKQVPDASAASNSANATSGANQDMATPAVSGMVQFNYGITGDANSLSVCSTRVPRELLGPDKRRTDVSGAPKVSDLRRISYWMASGQGLAYQEVKRVTGENADQAVSEPDQLIKYIPEVTGITFQYWDGSTWAASWDSNSPGADGDTPVGPPAAIEIVIEMTDRRSDEGEARTRKYRHVVSVPTGNNYSPPPQMQ
jgi:prepilin-type N-terminal cleavage/methylation domain-containing protein